MFNLIKFIVFDYSFSRAISIPMVGDYYGENTHGWFLVAFFLNNKQINTLNKIKLIIYFKRNSVCNLKDVN